MRTEFAMSWIGAAASCAMMLGAIASRAMAQCPTEWVAMGYDAAGALVSPGGGTMEMALWDPDGNGPLATRVAVVVDSLNLDGGWRGGVVALDPLTGRWEARFPNAAGTHVARVGSDQLVLAGQWFNAPGGVMYHGAARWDGNAWQLMESDTSPLVATTSLVSHGDGVAILVWEFNDNRGKVLEWHPDTGWTAIQTGIEGRVHALLSLGNGELVLGGSFMRVGGTPAMNIARWDGSSWHAMGQGLTSVNCLAQGPDGAIYAGLNSNWTFFDGSTSNVARWNGTAWERVGSGLTGAVGKILALRDGRVVAIARTEPFRIAGSAARPACVQLVNDGWVGIDGVFAGRVFAGVELDDGSLMLSGVFDFGSGAAQGVIRERRHDWCASCPPCMGDFDQDGGVTSADVGAFMDAWETGAACADVLYNGGVDGTDLAAFFAAYEAGGC